MEKTKLDSGYASAIMNSTTGTGGAGDARTAGSFGFGPILGYQEAAALYSSVWFASKIVNIPAEDMTKHWRTHDITDADPSLIQTVKLTEKKLHVKERVLTAIKWGRLFGGSLLLLGVRDDKELSEHLDVETIGQGDLEFLQVVDRYQVGVQETNTWTPFSESYLEPEYYNIFGSIVHRSRVIKFIGKQPTYLTLPVCNYFGESVLQDLYETLRDAMQGLAGASNLTLKANQDVLKTPQLWDLVGTPEEGKINKRFALMQAQRSLLNMLVLDSGEEFESIATTFSGLEGVLDKLLDMVVGSSNIPATRFFGQAPQGMNATGEGDMRNYYDMIASQQENSLRPKLEALDDVLIRSALGDMPESYGFTFNNLNQPTQKEERENKGVDLDNLKKLWEIGVPEEVLLKDALEMGLSKNLTMDLIKELAEDPVHDPDNETI